MYQLHGNTNSSNTNRYLTNFAFSIVPRNRKVIFVSALLLFLCFVLTSTIVACYTPHSLQSSLASQESHDDIYTVNDETSLTDITYFSYSEFETSKSDIPSSVQISDYSDPYYERQWALQKIRGTSVPLIESHTIVAILDTGIDSEHEDLKGKVIASTNFSESKTCEDRNGHGTHIAGIIAAISNNNKGIASIGSGLRLLNVKVAGDDGMVWASGIARGIRWSADNGVNIINLSLSVPTSSNELKAAAEYAWDKGVLIIASAGNNGSSLLTFPAGYDNTIAVAALDKNANVWENSNYGYWINAYCPGTNIYSTVPGNKYKYLSGTSMATAYITSIAASLMETAEDNNCNGRVNDEVSSKIKEMFGTSAWY